MSNPVQFHIDGSIACVTIDNPPVNATSVGVRHGLLTAVARFEADPDLRALVLCCEGKTFVAGADIKEFGKPTLAPALPEVLGALDRATKPIVAAVHGTVLGGGFELALACHYRVADARTRFGFPEVKLGLIPGAGGSQRVPRLAGLETAIKLIAEGNEISASAALAAGLVDKIADGELHAAALAFAQKLVAEGKGPRSSSTLPMPADDLALFDSARTALGRKMRGQMAPLIALDAIRLGYDLDFTAALEREYQMCKEAIAGPQSRALRNLFAAERVVARIPGLPANLSERPIERVGVVGLGPMGRGIAMAIAAADIPLILVAKDGQKLAKAQQAIAKQWSGSVAKGSLPQAEMDRRMSLMRGSEDLADLSTVDLVIEAVTEDMQTKLEVFRQLGAQTRPGAILASNTSYLDIDRLAEASGRPQDVCGMHFFNPANVMRLLENVRARATAQDVVATIMAFGRRIGKLPVLSGACEGFIVNRMLAKRSREGFFLVEEGGAPEVVDKVVVEFGFPMGPFALGDLAGLDVQAAARASRSATMSPRELRANFVEQFVERGRLGQKTGAGWYRYDENRKASRDPETDGLIAAHAVRHGLEQRTIGEREIRDRLLFAMINEGARILGEGIALRPEEIDVAMIHGLGFPSHTGGPMFWADGIGLDAILSTIEQFRAKHGHEYWAPAPLLVELAKQQRGFYK